jgi:hypothetical protein
MCRVEDADPWDFFYQETRRARIPHLCGECRRTIVPGERYVYSKGLFDKRWSMHRTCQHCEVAGLWLYYACGGYLFGDLRDELEEHFREEVQLRSPTLRHLIIGIRRKWAGYPVPDRDEVKTSLPRTDALYLTGRTYG